MTLPNHEIVRLENGETVPGHSGLDASCSTANGCWDDLIEDRMDSPLANYFSFSEWRSHWIVQRCCSNILPDEPMKLVWCGKRKKKMRQSYEKVPVTMEEEEDREQLQVSNTREVTEVAKEEVSFVYLLENPPAVRFLKFFFVTLIYILLTYYIIRWMDLEHDTNYQVSDFFLYDFNHVSLDILSYFTVGRLFRHQGVDRLFPTLFFMGSGCFIPSWTNTFKFLQHSVSAYEIVCRWPWQLFAYGLVVLVLSGSLLSYHVASFYQQRLLLSRSLEWLLCLLIFLLPFVNNPSFHLHHWYVSWMVGMHANANTLWSQATLAYLWGNYINGIAVYGRDPILSCAYPFYLSTTNLHCEFMACYSTTANSSKNTTIYKPYIAPDWRNCSANHYHL